MSHDEVTNSKGKNKQKQMKLSGRGLRFSSCEDFFNWYGICIPHDVMSATQIKKSLQQILRTLPASRTRGHTSPVLEQLMSHKAAQLVNLRVDRTLQKFRERIQAERLEGVMPLVVSVQKFMSNRHSNRAHELYSGSTVTEWLNLMEKWHYLVEEIKARQIFYALPLFREFFEKGGEEELVLIFETLVEMMEQKLKRSGMRIKTTTSATPVRKPVARRVSRLAV